MGATSGPSWISDSSGGFGGTAAIFLRQSLKANQQLKMKTAEVKKDQQLELKNADGQPGLR